MEASLVEFETDRSVTVVVVLVDHLDASNVARFKEAVVNRIGGPQSWLIDLSNVGFVDSTGLGALVSCLRRSQEQACRLALCGLQKRVLVLFELVRLYRILDIFETRESAVNALSEQ
jgi:anti-sigma B factor antagonist